MARIFISHSSRNNVEAIAMRDWLTSQGWTTSEIFLDLEDLLPGDRWRFALNDQNTTCEAVIVCLSDEWLQSPECLREFTLAESAGKPIFPVIVAPIRERVPRYVSDLQIIQLTDPYLRRENLSKLGHALSLARVAPTNFPWPPPMEPGRLPYRGLSALEEKDAAVFFGREAAIAKGLDSIRRMRDQGIERMMVILGASGSGKSSFLRAGLLARLQRDADRFLVLGVVRPGRAAVTGATGFAKALGTDDITDPKEIRNHLEELRSASPQVSPQEATPQRPRTLVLAIDQGEELFAADGDEQQQALSLLSELIASDSDIIVILTIRSDSFSELQHNSCLSHIPRVPFDLPPLTVAALREVIEGPGRLAQPPITFEPALTETLIGQMDSADALPLLALTLQQLTAAPRQDAIVRLEDYETGLGGLAGAVTFAAAAALNAAATDRSLSTNSDELQTIVRRAFIPSLVRLESIHSEPTRRLARLSDFPDGVRCVIRHLVDQRLLVSSDVAGIATVEVAHEAVLRNWRELAGWIDEERRSLQILESIRIAAVEFGLRTQDRSEGVDEAWVMHRGDRLAEALAVLDREDFSAALTDIEQSYVRACQELEKRTAMIRKIDNLRYEEITRLTRDLLEEELSLRTRQKPSDHRGVAAEQQAEIDTLRFVLGDLNRWHPEPPAHVTTRGAVDGYVEIWRFPCCNEIIGDFLSNASDPPSQFHQSGCQAIPDELRFSFRKRSNPWTSHVLHVYRQTTGSS